MEKYCLWKSCNIGDDLICRSLCACLYYLVSFHPHPTELYSLFVLHCSTTRILLLREVKSVCDSQWFCETISFKTNRIFVNFVLINNIAGIQDLNKIELIESFNSSTKFKAVGYPA